jgi:hypothetical protein
MVAGLGPDWELLERRSRQQHVQWLRSLTPAESFALYEDLHRLAASFTGDPEGSARLEQRRWREKLAVRAELLAAWSRMDERSARRAS